MTNTQEKAIQALFENKPDIDFSSSDPTTLSRLRVSKEYDEPVLVKQDTIEGLMEDIRRILGADRVTLDTDIIQPGCDTCGWNSEYGWLFDVKF